MKRVATFVDLTVMAPNCQHFPPDEGKLSEANLVSLGAQDARDYI